jgi:hypothetical protein
MSLNFIEPADVADAVVVKLNADIADFNYETHSVKTIAQIARKPDEDDHEFTPPWIGVFYGFFDEGEQLPQGHIHNFPTTIGVICSSTPGKSKETDALREAMYYARIVYNKVIGEYTINIGTEPEPQNELVYLKSAKQPIEILEATADLALVGVFFEYKETF